MVLAKRVGFIRRSLQKSKSKKWSWVLGSYGNLASLCSVATSLDMHMVRIRSQHVRKIFLVVSRTFPPDSLIYPPKFISVERWVFRESLILYSGERYADESVCLQGQWDCGSVSSFIGDED